MECVGVQLSFEKRGKFNVITAYRPPCSSMFDFIDDLESCLFEGGALAHHPLCLVGGFNCKSAQWWNGQSDSADGRLLECFAAKHNLLQVVDGPTHDVCGNCPSQLDLMFITHPTYLKCCSVLPPLSDHCPTVVQLDILQLRQQSAPFFPWDYAHTDRTVFVTRWTVWIGPQLLVVSMVMPLLTRGCPYSCQW